jgi:hypothetical protein
MCSHILWAKRVFPKTTYLYKQSASLIINRHRSLLLQSKEKPLSTQDSKIRTESRISWRQTGHLGATSLSTDIAHPWQHTRCPHGIKTERLLLIRHITHNCPSGTSPTSSSESASMIVCLCCWICLCSFHCFHLFQFLRKWKFVFKSILTTKKNIILNHLCNSDDYQN